MSAWLQMWVLAGSIYALCKWLTWRRAKLQGVPAWKQAAYLFAWPGMNAEQFLVSSKTISPPQLSEWLYAIAKTLLGIAILIWIVPTVPGDARLLRGWVGMVGMIFVLHFGSFQLLSCFWRTLGLDAKPLMNWPILAANLSDFWGRRWNTAFRDLTHRLLFLPLSTRLGARVGLLVGFLVSGLVHELVITIPAEGGYGLPTLYFVLQGIGLLAARSALGRRLGLHRGWKGRAFTAIVVIGPAFGLFPPPFILRVILPFLEALGIC